MKNMAELEFALKTEIDQWFLKACADNYTPFYLVYAETTPERNGGILIARDKGPNPDYRIAAQLNNGDTKEQNFNRLRAICRTLPVLSYE